MKTITSVLKVQAYISCRTVALCGPFFFFFFFGGPSKKKGTIKGYGSAARHTYDNRSIISIAAYPIGLAAILVRIFVSTFKIAIILI